MASQHEHIVMLSYPFYGHHAPYLPFIVALVQTTPVIVTIIATDISYVPRLEASVSRYPLDPSQRSLIRIVGVHIDQQTLDFTDVKAAINTLEDGEPLKCALTGTTYPAVPAPKAVVLDTYIFPLMHLIREASAKHDRHVNVYNWATNFPPFLWRIVAPEDQGGFGDVNEKLLEAGFGEDDEFALDIIREFGMHTEGDVMEVAGMPPMFDYEFFPETHRDPAGDEGMTFLMKAIRYMHTSFVQCDGAIFTTSPAFATSGLIDPWKEWLGEQNREVFVCYPPGPDELRRKVAVALKAVEVETITAPTNGETHTNGHTPAPLTNGDASLEEKKEVAKGESPMKHDAEVEDFLAMALEKYGKNSLIYISFGTLVWVNEPEKLWAVLDVLIEQNIPFIMAHASSNIEVPDEVKQKAKDSGLGLVKPWVPQQMILNHEATGWFLTHCGQNGAIQSLTAGVPMICWPVFIDQAFVAPHLVLNLDVAYQLYEVRNGEAGVQPLYRFKDHPEMAREMTCTIDAVKDEIKHVLEMAKGEDGERKRANAMKLKEQIVGEWVDETAMGYEEVRRFVKHAGL